MPMGRTHRAINTTLCLPLAVGSLALAHWTPLQALVFTAGFSFATFFMNPDLDLYSLGYKSWGPLRFLWLPYQKSLAHRCYISHFPVVSTLLRIVYLLGLPVIAILLLGSGVQESVRTQFFHWLPLIGLYVLVFIIGMVISDSIHTICDVISTDMKRSFSKHPHHHQTFWEHNNHRRPHTHRGRH